MGSSSTKRKSSSVNKKKRLSRKSSSQVRKRTRDRSRSKKEKSRKVLHEDSDSYSDSDSRSLSTSFSSKDSYSRKQSRSRTRKDGKRSRKRARRSPSRGTSSDSLRVKKRKVSKRKADLDSRKKSIKKKKKKSKRDLSPSSASQSSCSCSECWPGSSSCSESEYEKRKGGRSDKKYSYEDVKKDRSGTRQGSRLRSQSSPAHSRQTEDSGYYSEEKSIGVDYPKRLRSVITVVKAPESDEESELVKDHKTDYLVYDHDDYPSDRSNDSSECRNKMDLGHHSLVTSEAASTVKNVNDKDAFISNDRTFMVSGCDDEDKYDGRATWNGIEAKNRVSENEGEVFAGTVNPEAEDLESVLRKRALENLLKFRGGIPRKAAQNEKSDGNAQQTSRAKSVSTRVNTGKEDGNDVTTDSQLIDQAIRPAVSPTRLQIGQVTDPMQHSSIKSAAAGLVKTEDHKKAAVETIQSTRINETSLGSDSQGATPVAENVGSKPVRLVSTGPPTQKAGESSGVKPSTLPLKREPSGMFASVKQILTSNASHKSKSLAVKGNLDKSTAGTGSLTPQSGNKIEGVDLSDAADDAGDAVAPHASSPEPAASVEASSGDLQGDNTKDSSQYEQKTMSVMRGGEMVQVNYKVYIPKKASALVARRQLKR